MTNEEARAAAIERAEFEVQRLRIREELRRLGVPHDRLEADSHCVTVIERYSLPCVGRSIGLEDDE